MRTMVSAAEALLDIRSSIRPLEPKVVPLDAALGRALAEDIVSPIDVPGFDNSSMDGFALSDDDGTHTPDRRYPVIGESSAGRPFSGSIAHGAAVRIMTGAKVPDGAAAVIELERVVESEGSIRFERYPEAGRHIRRAGEDLQRDHVVLRHGIRLRPAQLGLLASIGRSTVPVVRQPKVAVVTTGSELVPNDGTLAEGQIYNSSAFVVPAMVREALADLASVRTVVDDRSALIGAFDESSSSDLLLTTGGVSAGAHDLVLEALQSLGVQLHFWKVRIKPGMPLAFGTWRDGRPVICLPGNPVSTGVTFQQFVRPALDALEGVTTSTALRLRAKLEHEMHTSDGKRHFSRGVAEYRDGQWNVRTTGRQSSGMLSSLAQANCLIIVPEETERVKAGETVEVEWL